jgi:5-methylcytosine-specific restriction endonuclease McrA
MSDLREFKFRSIYNFVDIIDSAVRYETNLFNFNEDYFLNSSTNFCRDTVLHQYIVCELLNHFRRDFRKNGECYDENTIESWYELFSLHAVEIEKFDFEREEFDLTMEIYQWFLRNETKFYALFDSIGEEVFHILFSNRNFLLNFNNLITNTVKEFEYPKTSLTEKETIKRVNIPKWVKTAVFHRDKGRCVFCNTDLTSIVNTFTNSNYDHIVPLDRYGINDPCNVQLCCEKCNKSKTNKEGATSNKYFAWWKRIKETNKS